MVAINSLRLETCKCAILEKKYSSVGFEPWPLALQDKWFTAVLKILNKICTNIKILNILQTIMKK